VKKGQREDSRGTDKQPDEGCPEGIPDVNDGRAKHVDDAATKLGCVFKVTYSRNKKAAWLLKYPFESRLCEKNRLG
jgi:hypothetical protein